MLKRSGEPQKSAICSSALCSCCRFHCKESLLVVTLYPLSQSVTERQLSDLIVRRKWTKTREMFKSLLFDFSQIHQRTVQWLLGNRLLLNVSTSRKIWMLSWRAHCSFMILCFSTKMELWNVVSSLEYCCPPFFFNQNICSVGSASITPSHLSVKFRVWTLAANAFVLESCAALCLSAVWVVVETVFLWAETLVEDYLVVASKLIACHQHPYTPGLSRSPIRCYSPALLCWHRMLGLQLKEADGSPFSRQRSRS